MLDLAQDRSIQQFYLQNDTLALEPHETETIPLEVVLAASYTEGTNLLKIFAALAESVPLNHLQISGCLRGGGSRNILEELLEAFPVNALAKGSVGVLWKEECE